MYLSAFCSLFSAVTSLLQKELIFQGHNFFFFSSYSVYKVTLYTKRTLNFTVGMENSFEVAPLLPFVQTFSKLRDSQCLTRTRPFLLALIRARDDTVCTMVQEVACKNILH